MASKAAAARRARRQGGRQQHDGAVDGEGREGGPGGALADTPADGHHAVHNGARHQHGARLEELALHIAAHQGHPSGLHRRCHCSREPPSAQTRCAAPTPLPSYQSRSPQCEQATTERQPNANRTPARVEKVAMRVSAGKGRPFRDTNLLALM